MPIPKSLLGKRTEAQYLFDSGVRGWAFSQKSPTMIPYAQKLYDAIGKPDSKRLAILQAIIKHNS